MSQKAAATTEAAKISKKCFDCGLVNFAERKKCARCKSDLSPSLTVANDNQQESESSGGPGRFRVRGILIFAAAVVVVLVSLQFYGRQDPQGKQEVPGEAIAQPATPQSKQPAQNSAEEDVQSQEAAKQVLTGLRHFQRATQFSLSYEEYAEMLTQLRADLNNTLPTFVRHNSSDESFRQEVAGALRDYTAAGNWWKTTIKNSSVLNDADRIARLQAEWSSAQTHLDNAEDLLSH